MTHLITSALGEGQIVVLYWYSQHAELSKEVSRIMGQNPGWYLVYMDYGQREWFCIEIFPLLPYYLRRMKQHKTAYFFHFKSVIEVIYLLSHVHFFLLLFR